MISLSFDVRTGTLVTATRHRSCVVNLQDCFFVGSFLICGVFSSKMRDYSFCVEIVDLRAKIKPFASSRRERP